jgi:glucan-binding YG repeat protein
MLWYWASELRSFAPSEPLGALVLFGAPKLPKPTNTNQKQTTTTAKQPKATNSNQEQPNATKRNQKQPKTTKHNQKQPKTTKNNLKLQCHSPNAL